jgi:protein-tyrosine phosphatase
VRAEVFLIPEVPFGRLAIMPRPRAGDWLEDEVASWQSSGLDVVVSLLDDHEVTDLGLVDEPAVCERIGVRLLRFPIPDRGVPASYPAATELVTRLVTELRSGRGVGIHCRIGVGRSALMAVSLLAALGIPVESAWASVARARGVSVPDTPAQRAWVAGWLKGISPQNAKSD